MKYFVALIFVVTTTFSAVSQTYEIGAFIGGANYIGDVGKTNFVAPKTTAFGGILKWNRSARHAFRASLLVANIEGDDLESSEERRKQRGLSFENNIFEASLGVELNFWDFDVYSGRPVSTPYLYTGLTYFSYNELFKNGNDVINDYDKGGTVAIPMVVGFKTTLGKRFVLGMEIGARYTFTDNLDGSFPGGGLEDETNLRFGNVNSDDWYVFTGLTLAVTFGRQPCYCNF